MKTNGIKKKIGETKKLEEIIKTKDLKYETKKYTYDFRQYKKIRPFSERIFTRKAKIVEAEEGQSNLLKNVSEFNNKSRAKAKEGKDKKSYIYDEIC